MRPKNRTVKTQYYADTLELVIECLQYRLMNRKPVLVAAEMKWCEPLDRIQCKDGFTVSVQAGDGIYSEPRSYTGPWTKVEVGYPDKSMPSLRDYCSESGQPLTVTDAVWAYVPIKEIALVILSHGGIVLHDDEVKPV